MKPSQKWQLLNSLNLTLGLYSKVKLTSFLLPELHMWQVTKKGHFLSIRTRNLKVQSIIARKNFFRTTNTFLRGRKCSQAR